ncbi:MAG: hypothetical protein ACTHOO_06930 [Alcanivorax sp.]
MEREKVDKIIKVALKVLFSLLFVLLFLSVMRIEATKKPQEEINAILLKQQQERIAEVTGKSMNENLPDTWPPKMNTEYPSLELIASDGKRFKLSDYKGKVIVLSYIDMSSPISQAQSGSGLSGPYGTTVDTDPYAEPFEDTLRKTLGDDDFDFPNDDVVQVKVLVYSPADEQASVDDAEGWAGHFDLTPENGVIVAVPVKDIRGEETDTIINGFQLIDKNHILRVDSSGPEPKHNLKMTLIPLVPKLLR